MNPLTSRVVAVIGLALLVSTAVAVETSPVLTFWPNAGGAAVAGAWTGRATGPSAGAWNPAGLAFCSCLEASVTAREMLPYHWFGHGALQYSPPLNLPPGSRLSLGALVTLATYETDSIHDPRGEWLGDYQPWDGWFALQGAYRFNPRLGIGATAGYFYRLIEPGWVYELAPSEGTEGGRLGRTFTANLGLLYWPVPGISVGAAVTNLGPDVTFTAGHDPDPLPTSARLGARFILIKADKLSLELMPELSIILPDRTGTLWEETWKALGAELMLWDIFFFRVGAQHAPAWDRTGFTYGLGAKYRDLLMLEISDDRYLHDLGSRRWAFSLTVMNIEGLLRGGDR